MNTRKQIKIRLIVVAVCLCAQSIPQKNLWAEPNAYSKASAKIAQENYSAAQQILKEGLEKNPKSPAMWNLLGYSYMMSGDYADAYQAYKNSSNLSADLVSLSGLQWSLLALKRYRQSIEVGKRILAIQANNYYAQLRISAAYLGMKNYEQAGGLYRNILRRYPKSADAYYGAGLSYEALGQKEKAKRYFARGLKLAPYHAGLRYKNGLAVSVKKIHITPFASITQFENSDNKTSTNNYGLAFGWTLNSRWLLNGSVQQSVTERPKGFRTTSTAKPTTQTTTTPGGGFGPSSGGSTSSRTVYTYNFQISPETGGRYINDVGQLGLRWIYSPRLSFYASGFALQSNDPFADNSAAGYASLSWGSPRLSIELGGGYLGFQRHIGRQATIGLHYQIWKNLYGSTQAFGQRINSLRYGVNNSYNTEFSTVYDPSFTEYQAWSKNYAAAQQSLLYYLDAWRFGIYYRGGELYTPILAGGTSIVYNTDRLDEGYGASIGYRINSTIDLNALYSVDRWTAATGETPSSKQGLLSVTFSF